MKFNNRAMALLGIPDLPPRAFIRKADGGIVPQGGGSAPTSTTTTNTGLPSWAEDVAKTTLAKQQALSNLPYETYGANRIQGFTPMQEQARHAAATMGTSPEFGVARGITEGIASSAQNASYDPSQFSTESFTGQGTADRYMNPYMQSVVDIQKREAGRQSDIQGTQQQAQAAQAGAFGGSRDAIMRAERERNLGQQMGDIQAQGSNAAFQQAQQQFNAEQNRGLTAQQSAEQSRQYGATYGMQGLQTGLRAAEQLGALGKDRFTQGMDINRLQSAYGAQQQAMGQQGLNQAYADWENQRDYPQQQLSDVASMMRGLPIGSRSVSTQTGTTGSPSFGQMLGAGATSLFGLKNFFADGGSVDSQQNIESIVSKLSDQQLAQAEEAAKARGDQEQLQAIQTEKAARASMNRGLASLPVNMDEMLPTEQSMARGGIVAFANGGSGYNPNASPSSDTGEDATLDDVEETNAPAQGPGNQAVYDEALRNQLAQIKALGSSNYESMKPEDYNRIIEERRASLIKGAGETPYAGMREDVKRMEENSATDKRQRTGLAAIQAAAAMLEGNDLSRGLAAGAKTFAGAYSQVLESSRAEKEARLQKLDNIAKAERAEKMGFNTAAIAAADQARKNRQDEEKAKVEKIKAVGLLSSKLAGSAKPGAVKAPTPAKVAEQLAAAEVALENNPKDPEAQRNVTALRRAAAQLAQKTVFSTTEYGGGRLGSAEAGQDITRQRYASEAAAKALKDVSTTKPFMNASDPVRAQMLADAESKAYANFNLAPPKAPTAAAPATAPKAGPAAAKPMSATDFNAKWATLKSGQKLVGPDGIEYTKK